MHKLHLNCICDQRIIDQIIAIAKQYDLDKIVLFGSRARGDCNEKSDIDLAVYKESPLQSEGSFVLEFEDINTLLKIDLVLVDKTTNKELLENIQKDGVVLYERSSDEN